MPALALAFVLALQSAPSAPLRIGGLAHSLTDADVAAIARLASEWDGRPWLLNASTTPIPEPGGAERWLVGVDLQPYRTTDALRRGDRFVASCLARGDQPRTWEVYPDGPYNWAQVVLPGRAFDDIGSDADLNQPFTTDLVVPDDELVEAVRFLRSGAAGADDRQLPIADISREYRGDTAVTRVSLRLDEGHTIVVELQRSGTGWTMLNRSPIEAGVPRATRRAR